VAAPRAPAQRKPVMRAPEKPVAKPASKSTSKPTSAPDFGY
jgi:hypothetical protein